LGESREKVGRNREKLGESRKKVGRNRGMLGETEECWEKTEKNREKNGKKLGETEKKLGRNAQRIIGLIINNSEITINELSEELNISTTAIEMNIAKLKAKGLLKRVGPDRGGYWQVVQNN
jgi:ATP-dependent DNA helicase RecG